MKTLVSILHHNTPQYTDVLYEMLEPEKKYGNYDLFVLDNGSDKGKESKYTTQRLEENVFFGGGLNACMQYVYDDSEYDSLLFLNSDLIVGKNFVKHLKIAFTEEFDVVSPCIIQPEKTQNHWRQMLPWGYYVPRPVKWIDLQAPLLSKKFIKAAYDSKVGENIIDPMLIRGWGIDVLFGIIAEKNGMQTAVCDNIPAVHLGSATLKALGNTNEYCKLASEAMYAYFYQNNMVKEYTNMTNWAEGYKTA